MRHNSFAVKTEGSLEFHSFRFFLRAGLLVRGYARLCFDDFAVRLDALSDFRNRGIVRFNLQLTRRSADDLHAAYAAHLVLPVFRNHVMTRSARFQINQIGPGSRHSGTVHPV